MLFVTIKLKFVGRPPGATFEGEINAV